MSYIELLLNDRSCHLPQLLGFFIIKYQFCDFHVAMVKQFFHIKAVFPQHLLNTSITVIVITAH